MTSLQTIVMGLVIVFLDIPPDGFDWIADPVGWVLVLLGVSALGERLPNRRGLMVTAWACLAFSVVSWPEGSPATLTPLLGWLFSLPTLAWCFLICDAVSDAVEGRLRWVMLGLRNAFAVVAPLPGLVYLAGQDWLSTPAEVLILVANLTLVLALSSASSRPGLVPEEDESARSGGDGTGSSRTSGRGDASPDGPAGSPAPPRPRPKTVGFSAAEAKRKARARREREAGSSTSRSASAPGARDPAGAAASPSSRPDDDSGGAQKGAEDPPSTGESEDTPVTGAEVIEKVRRRRRAREKAQGREGSSDG